MLLLGVLAALWMVPVPHAPAQAPTEEELKEFERQAEQLEKKQAETAGKAEAKRKADAAKKAAAAAVAKRKAVQKQAEEDRRPAEEARSPRPEPDRRERATEAASVLAGELMDISGGSFQMGCSDNPCDDDQRPMHTVSIKPFRIGKYEVTVGQFRRFVDAARYRTEAERVGSCFGMRGDITGAGRDWRNPGFPQTDRHPVVCVSWTDAKAYTQWLSRQGGGRYRLPSESESEYAARVVGRTRYAFGDSVVCDHANVADRTARPQFYSLCEDEAVYTAPVGEYRPNRFGLYDMYGNVWEWTEDCYHDSYAGAPSDGAAWTAGGCAERVIRGGSWDFDPMQAPSATRYSYPPDTRTNDVGFRLAQDR